MSDDESHELGNLDDLQDGGMQVFEDIGFMDEKYFVYFDDTDFCYRILKNKSHDIYYAPNIAFYHKVGSLTKSFIKKKQKVYLKKLLREKMRLYISQIKPLD